MFVTRQFPQIFNNSVEIENGVYVYFYDRRKLLMEFGHTFVFLFNYPNGVGVRVGGYCYKHSIPTGLSMFHLYAVDTLYLLFPYGVEYV